MKRLVFGVVIAALLPAVVLADWSNPLLTAGGMTGWTGTRTFSAPGTGGTFYALVDHAVFAPGTYPAGSFNLSPTTPYTPSAGEYVYAYEFYNNGGTGDLSVKQLDVGLDGSNAIVGVVGYDDGASFGNWHLGVRASAQGYTAGHNVAYYFTSPELWPVGAPSPPAPANTPGYSFGLVFTSPNPPRWMMSTVIDGGASDMQLLPSPVPAPGAALLGVIGLGVVGRIKRYLG